MIYTGDCIEVMATLPAESVDAVVTDPPAGISFMGKGWDHHKGGRDAWVAWMTEVMRGCYRVLKPGGHILVWALPRTSHWTGWAMESAGFEMRDKLIHAFASGFPKSHNLNGDWKGWGTSLKPAYEDWWLARKPLVGTVAANVLAHGTGALNIDATRIPTDAADAAAMERVNSPGSGRHGPVADTSNGRWEGTIGTGQMDTTKGRWPANLILTDPIFDGGVDGVVGGGRASTGGAVNGGDHAPTGYPSYGTTRYDFDGYGDAGTYSRFFLVPKSSRSDREPVLRGETTPVDAKLGLRHGGPGEPGKGSKEGYEYHPSPRVNVHPTTKPTELMRHLVRLVTPPGGTVLDCFAGSGTTALACEQEGFRWIAIEKEPEYVAIMEARLNGTQRGLGLDVAAPTAKRASTPGAFPAKANSTGQINFGERRWEGRKRRTVR